MKTKILAIALIAAGFLIVNLSINSDFIGWVGHEKSPAADLCPGLDCGCTVTWGTWCGAWNFDCWYDKDGDGDCDQFCDGVTIDCQCDKNENTYCTGCPMRCKPRGSETCHIVRCDSMEGCGGVGCPDNGSCPSRLCSYGGNPPCSIISSCTCDYPDCTCPTNICVNGCCTQDPGGCCTGPGP